MATGSRSGPSGSIAERLAVLALVLFLPLLLIEGASHLYLWLAAPGRVDPWVYLSSSPPAYQNADYYSEEFVYEAMRSLRMRRGAFGSGFRDHRGKYVNVIGGKRKTTDQPASFRSRVLVYGASNVFSRRVPDDQTIPSHLQRLLNADHGSTYQVVNLGAPGNALKRMVQKLRVTPIHSGDIVIFYAGLGEIFNPLFSLRSRRKFAEDNEFGTLQRLNPVQRTLYQLRLAVGDYSAAVRLLFEIQTGRSLPEFGDDEDELRVVLKKATIRYITLLLRANRYVTAKGGKFYNFLQPNLYVQESRSPNEQWLLENELKAWPGMDLAIQRGYPMLRLALDAARAAGVESLDVSDVLLDRDPGQEVYLDAAHVNHEANEMIAKRLYLSIFDSPVQSEI